MKYCKYCGSPLEEEGLFCPKCGKSLSSLKVESTNQEVVSKLTQCANVFSSQQSKYDLRDQTQIKIAEMSRFRNAVIVIVCLVVGFFISDALDFTFWEMGIQELGVVGTFVLIGIILPIFIIKGRKKKSICINRPFSERILN